MRIVHGTNGYDVVMEDGSTLFWMEEHGEPSQDDIDQVVATNTLVRAQEVLDQAAQVDAPQEIQPILLDITTAQATLVSLQDNITTLQQTKADLSSSIQSLRLENTIDIGIN